MSQGEEQECFQFVNSWDKPLSLAYSWDVHILSFGADGKMFTGFKWEAVKTQAVLNRLTKCLRVRCKEKMYMSYIHFSSEILTGDLH